MFTHSVGCFIRAMKLCFSLECDIKLVEQYIYTNQLIIVVTQLLKRKQGSEQPQSVNNVHVHNFTMFCMSDHFSQNKKLPLFSSILGLLHQCYNSGHFKNKDCLPKLAPFSHNI